MKYQELLLSTEWKNKRKKILDRDYNTCQRCGYLSGSYNFPFCTAKIDGDIILHEVGKLNSDIRIVIINDKEDGLITCKTPKDTPNNISNNDVTLIINFSIKGRNIYPFNGATINNVKPNLFDINEEINLKLSNHFKLEFQSIDFNKWEIDRQGYYLVSNSSIREFIKSQYLHVHHLCYRKSVQMWNQNDDEYITLCNICHRIVHENQLIPYYNEVGDIYQYMTPCWKCGGQRYLECYKNILNGVCFACDGNGYQSLKII